MLQRNGVPKFTTDPKRIANKAAVWMIKTPDRGGEGPVPLGEDVLIMNAYKGNYLLERNGNPVFTTKDARIKMAAAVWNIKKLTDFFEAQKPKKELEKDGTDDSGGDD